MAVQVGTHNLETGFWTLDPAHSEVGFSVRYAGISKVRGKFAEVASTIRVRDDEPETFEITATAKTESFTTGDIARDEHVKSSDFFDAATYPEISFNSTEVDFDGEDFTLRGDLTIKGITQTVEFKGSFNGVARDPFGLLRAGMEATTVINRKDFGIVWNAQLDTGGVLVSDKVTLVLDLSFVFDE